MILRLSLVGISLACLTLGAGLSEPISATAETSASRPAPLREGDILVQQTEQGWSAVKILAVDSMPGGASVAHCLLYAPASARPEMGSLTGLQVFAQHAPISGSGFQGWEKIGSKPVTKAEAAGFITYLKITDFSRYLKYTGQNPNQVISAANEHYKKANGLSDAGRRAEAIAEYDKAIDLFPHFYEAIDNRAFTFMELGQYAEALADFEQSLRVNPDGFSAFFSKGECLMRLGRLDAAEAVFSEGQTRFPEKGATFAQFRDRVRAMKIRGN